MKSRVALLAGATLCMGFCYGYISHRNDLFPSALIGSLYRGVFQDQQRSAQADPPDGQRKKPPPGWALAADHEIPDVDRDGSADLTALGYLSGYKLHPGTMGVTVLDPELVYDGFNYYTSGHAPEVILMGMDGTVLHRWRYEFRDAWPDTYERFLDQERRAPLLWRHAHLFENGDLLAIFDGHGIVKLDASSNLLWSYADGCHHDSHIIEDGSIYVLTSEEGSYPEIRDGKKVIEDYVSVLTPSGALIKKVSVVQAFMNSVYAPLLNGIPNRRDILHTNSLEVLDGALEHKSPAFRAGNVLISARETSVIAVIDMDAEKVVWAQTGMWKGQHHPTVLENGNILLFDNQGHHGYSKVLEFDPFSQEPAWSYQTRPPADFYSRLLGFNQRLPNGNTLITESTSGRSFEVTEDNELVWEFFNPKRSGDNEELIAVVFEMVRIPPDFPLDWLEH